MQSKSKSNPMLIGVAVLVIIALILAGLFLFSRSTPPAEPSLPAPAENAAQPAAPIATPMAGSAQNAVAEPVAATQKESAAAEPAAAAPAEVTAITRTAINGREGPSTSYPKIGSLPEKTEVVVTGKNDDGGWLLVKNGPDELWVSGDPELIDVDRDLLANLPVMPAPFLAYDAANPKVQEVLDKIPLVVHHEASNTCASNGGLNHLLPGVVAGNVLGPHAGDFVLGGDNVLFKVDGGTFVLIRENPVARFEGGKESLPLAEALNLFARGDIVWTGSFGEWPARGVPGCDPAAKP